MQMTDRVLLAAYSHDLTTYRTFAEEHHCGLEIHTFTDPAVLNGACARLVASCREQLEGFAGPLGMHGAFYDLISGSLDPEVVALSRRRYLQSLEIATDLGAGYVVFHANYLGAFKLPNYRTGWHERQVVFWSQLVEDARARGITVLLENMWADDPRILADLFEEVSSPWFRACLDVSHATLFSKRPLQEWLGVLRPYLHCCHLNNHDGETDRHWPLTRGVIDYGEVLSMLRALPVSPLLTLELPDWSTIVTSLPLFQLNACA